MGHVALSALFLGSLALVALLGALAPAGGAPQGSRSVAAVQGGGKRGTSAAQVDPATVTAAELAALRRVPVGTQLTVLPEDVVALPGPLAGSAQDAVLSQAARALRTTLVVGITSNVATQQFRNYVAVYGPSGALLGEVEKVHRVPFGEYVPDRAFFSHLASLSGVPLDAVPGHGDGVLRTPAAGLGTMVSYEVFFAARGRSATRAGAQLLIVPTNTSSYATNQVPSQEIAASRLQAVSEGRDLVQAAPTGFSAIIDHRGRVLERTVLGRRQVLVADVELRTGRTVYEHFGDLPVLVAAAVLLIAGWLAARTGADAGADASDAAARERRRRLTEVAPVARLRNR
jgi:apolipoprotein N-acyltransferase